MPRVEQHEGTSDHVENCMETCYIRCHCPTGPASPWTCCGLCHRGLLGMQKKNIHECDQWMPTANAAMPPALQGIYWMDGNGRERLFSLASAEVDVDRRRVVLNTAAPVAWAATVDSGAGMDSLCGQRMSCCHYDMRFDEGYSSAQILIRMFGCCTCPSGLCDFTMSRSESDGETWDRPSRVCGLSVSNYALRRIVDGEGRRTAHYAAMVEKVPANAIVFRAPGAKVMHRNEDV